MGNYCGFNGNLAAGNGAGLPLRSRRWLGYQRIPRRCQPKQRTENPGFSGELLFRYLINKRFALKTSLATASISGNSADFKNVYPNNAQYAFDAQYYDAAVAFEFNFMNFGMNTDYRNLKRLVPYLSLGLGASYSSCSAFAVNIPISAGAKFKLTNRWNLGLEMRARMMLGDKIDGLSDLYNVKSSFMKIPTGVLH